MGLVIILFLRFCYSAGDWGKCNDGDVRPQFMDGTLTTAEYGTVEIQVNGVKVSETVCMKECCAFAHDNPDPAGKFKWAPSASGQYEIKAQITNGQKYAYLRISSFILA